MIIVLGTIATAPVSATVAKPVNPSVDAAEIARIDSAVSEASLRFAVPQIWIKAVITAESASNAAAVSPKGAMGLMQLMPATWNELRQRHGLGDDVFNPRDNILAGTAYLRFLFDRFGMEGFIAAYNAGPKRYEEHAQKGKSLPVETQVYVTRVRQLLGTEHFTTASVSPPAPGVPWSTAPLFAPPDQPATQAAPAPSAPQSSPFVDLRPAPSLPMK